MKNYTPFQQALEALLKSQKVRFFLDTCFVLEEKAMDRLTTKRLKLLADSGATVVLPLVVQREIDRLAEKQDSIELSTKAQIAQHTLSELIKDGLIRVVGNADDGSFADPKFVEIFARFRLKYNLVLLTQDKKLSRDILRINATESSYSKYTIWVGSYEAGGIKAFNTVEQFVAFDQSTKKTAPKRKKKVSVPDQARALDNRLIGERKDYKSGDCLTTTNGETAQLGEFIAQGGEGSIFKISNSENLVAKIYAPDRRTQWRVDKLKEMLNYEVDDPQIAWPKFLLLDQNENVVGYAMRHAKGMPLQHTLFGKARMTRYCPNWSRIDLVLVAQNIAQKVQFLHKKGVIVGDLNPMNFLVEDALTVHLVDVDSVQIGDYPCPVGMVNFKAPEITESSFQDFLRTEAHENFALASLLFMVLMGGKAPFSFQGGGDPATNIKARNFPYVHDRKNIPAGAYRFIWSYFPKYIKSAFEEAFTHEDPEERPHAARWVRALRSYSKSLEKEPIADANSLWPVSFVPKKGSKLKQLHCDHCSERFTTSEEGALIKEKFKSVLCDKCRFTLTEAHKGSSPITCRKCKGNFIMHFGDFISNTRTPLAYCETCINEIAQKGHPCKRCNSTTPLTIGSVYYHLAHGGFGTRYCDDCVDAMAAVRRHCTDCGHTFQLEPGQIRFFLRKSYELPIRCKPCIEDKKMNSRY